MTKEKFILNIWDNYQNIQNSCGMYTKDQALIDSINQLDNYIKLNLDGVSELVCNCNLEHRKAFEKNLNECRICSKKID